MGRLMDSVMAAVGLKPSDRVILTHDPIDREKTTDGKPPPSLQSLTANKPTDAPQGQPQGQPQTAQEKPQSAARSTSENVDTKTSVEMAGDNVVLEDCWGCKLVGTGSFWGMGGTVMWMTYKAANKKPLGPVRKRLQLFSGGMISMSFILVGFMRLLNKGIFDPNKKGLTLEEHYSQEFEDLKKLFGQNMDGQTKPMSGDKTNQ